MNQSHSFTTPHPPEAVQQRAVQTLERLGTVTEVVSGQLVAGRVASGFQEVALRVSWTYELGGGSRITVQGSSWGVAAKRATRRFEAIFRNLDNLRIRGHRMEMLPLVLAGTTAVVVATLVLVMRLLGFW
jgi:hypothetical protein